MAKIDNITYDEEVKEINKLLARQCRLSKKSLQLLGLKAFKMAVGRREEDHDMCIHILIDYLEHLEDIEQLS